MTWSADKTIVNSWNEWDPLRHVIVGCADDCHIPPAEPALDAKVPEDSDMRGQWGRRPQETIDRANELLDNFANMLRGAVCGWTGRRLLIFPNLSRPPIFTPTASLAACRRGMCC